MKLKEWSYFIKILEVYDSPKDERFKDNPLAKSLVSSSILDPETGHYRYSSRGHHPAIIINKNGELKLLELRGTFIGLNKIVKNEDLVFEQGEGILQEGDKLYLYTDGIIELKNIKGEQFGTKRFYSSLISLNRHPINKIIQEIKAELFDFSLHFEDDISLLGFEFKRNN